LSLELPPFFGEHHLFGVSQADMLTLMATTDLRLKNGRLPQPRTNELVLTEEVAAAIGLQLGDQLDNTLGRDSSGESWYEAIPSPLVLVGILEGSGSEPAVRLGFVSYEYVSSHEAFSAPWSPGLVVVAQPGRKAEVDQFLEAEIASGQTNVMTHHLLAERSAGLSATFYLTFGLVDLVVAVVIALVVGAIHQISQARRLEEFGVLNALGHSKSRLIRRATLEAVAMAGLGWVLGLVLAWLLFALLKSAFYVPRGMPLNLATLTPVWFSLPIPLATVAIVALSTRRTFARLDAVAIVERGQLSMEAGKQRKATRSAVKPLSPTTFYQRHRRRALLLVAALALMILGVSFPAFLFAPVGDAMKPFAEPLRYVGILTPRSGATVDPGVVAQVRAHPTIARVIPAMALPLRVAIPPIGWEANFYGVSLDDMQTLVDLLDMQVKEGRLPQPRTNEIALSEAIVQNRGWQLGDTIGAPVERRDRGIPTELVIVGILAPQAERQSDPWLGFASYEYLSSHEQYASSPVHLITIPAEGQKAEMDAWLRETVHNDRVEVYTYKWMLGNYRMLTWLSLAVFGVVEGIVAVVAALALAVLSYTFFVQRREEFGILHAIGRSRSWLVRRTARETLSTVGVAWLLSAVVCGLGLAFVQAAVYAPRGLEINILSPAPWLFTLPLPLAVIAVSSGLVSRMLRKLDPVAVVERR
jgi:cell division protein FtsX